jgi:hypothetical protein
MARKWRSGYDSGCCPAVAWSGFVGKLPTRNTLGSHENSIFFWKSYSDNYILRGMVIDRERKDETLRHTGRSKRTRAGAYFARTLPPSPCGLWRTRRRPRGLENMCFCETNRIHFRVKTWCKILRQSWMQNKILRIPIRFVWNENDVTTRSGPGFRGVFGVGTGAAEIAVPDDF